MICLTSARFTMKAEVLRWRGAENNKPPFDGNEPNGSWEQYQDPFTGQIKNVWKPGLVDEDSDPLTPPVEEIETFKCQARGVISQGVYASGSAEIFGLHYDNTEVVRLWVPKNVIISKSDRITNIRDSKSSTPVFIDYDFGNRPTIFNVHGVTPLFDGFNRHIQNYVMLERAPDDEQDATL